MTIDLDAGLARTKCVCALFRYQKKALEDFQAHKINVTFATFPGAHKWKVWRHSLADLAPKLFR